MAPQPQCNLQQQFFFFFLCSQNKQRSTQSLPHPSFSVSPSPPKFTNEHVATNVARMTFAAQPPRWPSSRQSWQTHRPQWGGYTAPTSNCTDALDAKKDPMRLIRAAIKEKNLHLIKLAPSGDWWVCLCLELDPCRWQGKAFLIDRIAKVRFRWKTVGMVSNKPSIDHDLERSLCLDSRCVMQYT